MLQFNGAIDENSSDDRLTGYSFFTTLAHTQITEWKKWAPSNTCAHVYAFNIDYLHARMCFECGYVECICKTDALKT